MTEEQEQHKTHGVMLGLGSAVVLRYTTSLEIAPIAVLAGLIGYGATSYMLKYGHHLPHSPEPNISPHHVMIDKGAPHTMRSQHSSRLRHS